MLVWNEIPSITPMISTMRPEDCLISSMRRIALPADSPVRRATSVACCARSAAVRAASAF